MRDCNLDICYTVGNMPLVFLFEKLEHGERLGRIGFKSGCALHLNTPLSGVLQVKSKNTCCQRQCLCRTGYCDEAFRSWCVKWRCLSPKVLLQHLYIFFYI